MKYCIPIIMLCTALFGVISQAQAKVNPVVHIVLFFNPDCEHCQQVMNNDLPPLQAKYGTQLEILQIDTSKRDGIRLYQAMTRYFQLTSDRLGTPTIVIDTTILVGSDEIPARLPGLIAEYHSKGGIDWPGIPGLSLYVGNADISGSNPGPQQTPQSVSNSSEPLQSGGTTIWERFATNFKKDVTANSLAVVILAGMVISLVAVIIIVIKTVLSDKPHIRTVNIPSWVILLLVFAGIGIAAYMSFIEVGKKPALCGPVGHCNEVQNSPYAKLFGILPIGILGLMGYAAILIAWGTKRFGPKSLRSISTMALWGLATFGVAFSIYLTFLEPFVIGAACIWCLSSALVMTALLWVTTPGLQESLVIEDDIEDDDLLDLLDDSPPES